MEHIHHGISICFVSAAIEQIAILSGILHVLPEPKCRLSPLKLCSSGIIQWQDASEAADDFRELTESFLSSASLLRTSALEWLLHSNHEVGSFCSFPSTCCVGFGLGDKLL